MDILANGTMSERFSGNVSLGERKMCPDPLIELGESIGRSESELLQQLPLHRPCTLCVLDTERDGERKETIRVRERWWRRWAEKRLRFWRRRERRRRRENRNDRFKAVIFLPNRKSGFFDPLVIKLKVYLVRQPKTIGLRPI